MRGVMATKKDDAASRAGEENAEWTRKDFEQARPVIGA